MRMISTEIGFKMRIEIELAFIIMPGMVLLIIFCDLLSNSVRDIPPIPPLVFYRQGNQSVERLKSLPKVIGVGIKLGLSLCRTASRLP